MTSGELYFWLMFSKMPAGRQLRTRVGTMKREAWLIRHSEDLHSSSIHCYPPKINEILVDLMMLSATPWPSDAHNEQSPRSRKRGFCPHHLIQQKPLLFLPA